MAEFYPSLNLADQEVVQLCISDDSHMEEPEQEERKEEGDLGGVFEVGGVEVGVGDGGSSILLELGDEGEIVKSNGKRKRVKKRDLEESGVRKRRRKGRHKDKDTQQQQQQQQQRSKEEDHIQQPSAQMLKEEQQQQQPQQIQQQSYFQQQQTDSPTYKSRVESDRLSDSSSPLGEVQRLPSGMLSLLNALYDDDRTCFLTFYSYKFFFSHPTQLWGAKKNFWL